MAPESKHGRPADGWAKLGVQLPSHIADRFKEVAAEGGLGGSRNLVSAAVSLVLAMPEKDRDALCKFVVQRTYKNPSQLDIREVLDFFRFMERQRDSSAVPIQDDRKWEVLYIADPEVTLPPGRKPSDRAGEIKKRGTA